MNHGSAGFVVKCNRTGHFLNPHSGRLDAEVDWTKHLFRKEQKAQSNAHAYSNGGNLEVVPVTVVVEVPE